MTTGYVLGPFRLDIDSELLSRGAESLALGRRAVALLRVLVEQPGVMVSKDTLIEAVWPGQAVEESNLSVQITALRRALRAEPGGERWIETLPRRGYRYVGPVVTEMQEGAAATPQQARPLPDVASVRFPTISDHGEAPLTLPSPPDRGERDAKGWRGGAEPYPELGEGGSARWENAPARHNEGERRQITAMCCELVGVAAGADGSGLEELRDRVAEFQRRLAAIAARHSGHLASRLGNAVLALFGWPAANEDDAERAVRAGLELCAASGSMINGADRPVRCRIGIATGMAIIADPGAAGEPHSLEIFGDAVDLALQLQLSAPPGTVAIGPTTRRLVGNLFECRELAAVDANGGGAPLRRWQVLAESAVASRFEALHPMALTPLVGREEEVDLLLRRWRQAKGGDGQVVLLAGEPGIGKSRLAAALSERLEGEPHTRLRCFCSAYHQDSALSPFVDHLGRAAGFAREDDSAAKWKKLRALLAQTGATPGEAALFADLLSLPGADAGSTTDGLAPQQKKERTLAALIRQLETLACEAPVLMLFEDAHWADPSSCDLLDRVVERIAQLPVLLVVTFRPEYRPPWTGEPNVAALTLGRLGRREAAVLADHAGGGRPLPGEVVARIVDHADGVPLFVEELTKSVLESGLLRKEDGRYVLDGALPSFAIPASLHDSLTARLDRATTARDVAQIGAAIGRRFSYALVQIVSGLCDDELQSALARLVAAELLFQRGTPPDAVYSFKHALVQDAAYAGLLRDARRKLHLRIAAALEAGFPELVDSQPEIVAQHYAEAGLAEKSVIFWGKAGRRSASRSAMAEAAAQFQKGLDQLALLPDTPKRQRQELEFCSVLGAVLRAVKGTAAPETGRAYARARELWEQLGFPAEFLHIPYGQSHYYLSCGKLDLALRLAEEVLHLSRQRSDSAGLILGHFSLGRNMLMAGRFALSRSHFEEVLALYDPIFHGPLVHWTAHYPHIASQAHLGSILFCLGFPDQALAQSNAAIAEARRLAHLPSLAMSLSNSLRVLSRVEDNAVPHERAEQLVAIAIEQGFSYWRAEGTIYRGWNKVQTGDVTDGISLLRSGLSAHRATRTETGVPAIIRLLAMACEITGQIEEALTQSDEALRIVERTGERWLAAELYRHKGQLLLRQGHVEASEELYRQARGIAREQQAKMWELRACVSLARLWRDHGRRAAARDLLAPVYGWFSEGLATPDLKEAKALLDELA